MSGIADLIDISMSVRAGTPEWPGDTPYSCQWTWRRADGQSVNVSAITTSPHVGTHADAPLHVRDDWRGAHELPLECFVGRARVVSVPDDAGEVEFGQLAGVGDAGVARLLLRTGCTVANGTFPERWPVLSAACVQQLLARGLMLLGVDAPSVDDRQSTTLPVHHALFSGGAFVLENLELRHVPDGEYELFAFPLKLEGLDAAPVRAVLRPLSSA
ncbi:MAG TPA: cyclase family protein [Gemmatimonadaceae bacterium]